MPRLARRSFVRRVVAVSSVLCAAAMGSGCQLFMSSEGGRRGSYGEHVYASTSWQPKTVSLLDTRSGETVWSMDVPVGAEVKIVFSAGSGDAELYPDKMRWELRGNASGSGKIDIPGTGARRLDMTVRAAPEYPEAQ